MRWLTDDERARHERFRHDADRQMFLLGRLMARALVGRALGVAPTAWPWREGPHGRPEIAAPARPLRFNLVAQRRPGGLRARARPRRRRGRRGPRAARAGPGHRPRATARRRKPPTSSAQGDRLARPVSDVLDAEGGVSEGARPRHLGALSDISFSLDADGVRIGFLSDRWPAPTTAGRFSSGTLDARHLLAVAADRRPTAPRSAFVVAAVLMPPPLPRDAAARDERPAPRPSRQSRGARAACGAHPDDWLIVAGDVGEKPEHLVLALDTLVPRFARVIWTPGNHDLWCPPGASPIARAGQARYDELVAICRACGVLTPEDPYLGMAGRARHVHRADVPALRLQLPAAGRARRTRPSRGRARPASCPATSRCSIPRRGRRSPAGATRAATSRRRGSTRCRPDARTVLVNHWPLRYDLARPPRVPRFSLWCGTTRTEDWAAPLSARAPSSPAICTCARRLAARRALRGSLARLSARLARRARHRLVPARDPARHRTLDAQIASSPPLRSVPADL